MNLQQSIEAATCYLIEQCFNENNMRCTSSFRRSPRDDKLKTFTRMDIAKMKYIIVPNILLSSHS